MSGFEAEITAAAWQFSSGVIVYIFLRSERCLGDIRRCSVAGLPTILAS